MKLLVSVLVGLNESMNHKVHINQLFDQYKEMMRDAGVEMSLFGRCVIEMDENGEMRLIRQRVCQCDGEICTEPMSELGEVWSCGEVMSVSEPIMNPTVSNNARDLKSLPDLMKAEVKTD